MRYLGRFLATLFGLLGVVATFNAAMDPYDLLGTPIVPGFNQIKSPAPDRFFKPLQVSLRQPRTVLIGDSRIMMGIDPNDVPGGQAYNLGVPAATLGEEIALARHVLADTPADTLVLGFNYLSFNSKIEFFPSFRLAILGRFAFWRGLPDILISERALARSRNALLRSRRHAEPAYLDNGLRLVPDKPLETSTETDRILTDVREYARSGSDMRGTDAALARLDAFLATSPPGIKIVAFVTPGHAALREVLEQTGAPLVYEAWLARLTAICAAHGVPLWDFGGYNRITEQEIATAGDSYYDGSHFRPAVGRLVLDTILRGAPVPDFGARLTPETLPAYLVEQHAARAAWRNRQSADVREIEAAIQSAGK